jgi:hypothetical protein
MATLRSDVIIPEVFTPYVIRADITFRDAFLASRCGSTNGGVECYRGR